MPSAQAKPLHVSSLQQELLHQIVQRTTSAQRLVKRAQIILEALKGTSNTSIAQRLQIDYETVRRWRDRWHAAQSRLQALEETGKRKLLKQAIEVLLTDEQRPGAPATFTFEQFMQIMALACEKPEASDRPVSTWTPRELADEAVKRGILERISPRTVERFLTVGAIVTSQPRAASVSPTRRERLPADGESDSA
jgi:putative transposase